MYEEDSMMVMSIIIIVMTFAEAIYNSDKTEEQGWVKIL